MRKLPDEVESLIKETMDIRRQFIFHRSGNPSLPMTELERLKQRRTAIEDRLRELGYKPHFQPLEETPHAAPDYAGIGEMPAQSSRRVKSSIIYASEIDKFLYCQRSWWYSLQGEQSSQLPQMEQGTKQHEALAQKVQQVEQANTNVRLFIGLVVLLIIAIIGLSLFLG